jgi:hypothetical protein
MAEAGERYTTKGPILRAFADTGPQVVEAGAAGPLAGGQKACLDLGGVTQGKRMWMGGMGDRPIIEEVYGYDSRALEKPARRVLNDGMIQRKSRLRGGIPIDSPPKVFSRVDGQNEY